jgi:hypothetical protein
VNGAAAKASRAVPTSTTTNPIAPVATKPAESVPDLPRPNVARPSLAMRRSMGAQLHSGLSQVGGGGPGGFGV